MNIRLHFLGAAQSVTGSCYLLEIGETRVLVDCGMYQERDLRSRNWQPFTFDPSTVQAVLLTHAHADHCGLLPKLVRDGFQGPIYCTAPTADIAHVVLTDSAKIQEEDSAYKKKRHAREGRQGPHPEAALYGIEDAERCNRLFAPITPGKPVALVDGATATFHDAGHILGSCMVEVRIRQGNESRVLLFSGDVGRAGTPLLHNPTVFAEADYVVCESTYGNRLHEPKHDVPGKLAAVVNSTRKAGGNLIIPSFAVERAQEIMFRLSELLVAGRIPQLPVFLDSPMAVRVTQIFQRNEAFLDAETRAAIRRGHHPCDFPGLVLTRSVEESRAINDRKDTSIIIAGSGMCDGGRIKHHLANNISRPESTVLFVCYQAVGTLGRVLVEKASEVRIFGQTHAVRAGIEKINGFSGHADRDELFAWLSALKRAPRQIFLTHGDAQVAAEFCEWIKAREPWDVTVPAYKDVVSLA